MERTPSVDSGCPVYSRERRIVTPLLFLPCAVRRAAYYLSFSETRTLYLRTDARTRARQNFHVTFKKRALSLVQPTDDRPFYFAQRTKGIIRGTSNRVLQYFPANAPDTITQRVRAIYWFHILFHFLLLFPSSWRAIWQPHSYECSI